MTHAEAFLQDILAHPDDDAPRLIFADWLEEQGDPNSVGRAEFIRVQCAVSKEHLPERGRAELEGRQQELLEHYGDEWAALRRLVRRWAFHRGFIDEVSMRPERLLSAAGRRMFRLAPIQHAAPVARDRRHRAALQCAGAGRLRAAPALAFPRSQRQSAGESGRARIGRLAAFDELDRSQPGAQLVRRQRPASVGRGAAFGRLDAPGSSTQRLRRRGMRALVEAIERLARGSEGVRLRILDVRDNRLSAAARRVLADSPLMRRLIRCHPV